MKKTLVAIITIVLIIISVFLVINNISIEKNKNDYQDYIPQEEISDEQLRQTKIILYFANSETGELETETKIIDANKLLENPYNVIMEMLIKGPNSSNLIKLIPDGTILHEIIIENGCATINVSSEFLNYENDEIKLKMINSIVNTLSNLKEIDSVKFLINGEINDNLKEVYVKNN